MARAVLNSSFSCIASPRVLAAVNEVNFLRFWLARSTRAMYSLQFYQHPFVSLAFGLLCYPESHRRLPSFYLRQLLDLPLGQCGRLTLDQ